MADDDDLAPCIARSSVAMIVTMHDKLVLIFHEVGFQVPVINKNVNPSCKGLITWKKNLCKQSFCSQLQSDSDILL